MAVMCCLLQRRGVIRIGLCAASFCHRNIRLNGLIYRRLKRNSFQWRIAVYWPNSETMKIGRMARFLRKNNRDKFVLIFNIKNNGLT